MTNKVIAISGLATTGKDTLARCISAHFSNYKFQRVALADKLKKDLDEFLLSKFGISAFTSNPSEKKKIRPLMVEYGRIKRTETEGKYFSSNISGLIEDLKYKDIIPIITDIRYDEYPQDEYYWVKSLNAFLIHIEREGINPPNSEEERNDPKLKSKADLNITWPTLKDEIACLGFLKEKKFLKQVEAYLYE